MHFRKKNGGRHVVFQAEMRMKRSEYFGKVPNIFFCGPLREKKCENMPLKPFWAKWVRMFGKTKVTMLFFTPKSTGSAPNTLNKYKPYFFWAPLTDMHALQRVFETGCGCDASDTKARPTNG